MPSAALSAEKVTAQLYGRLISNAPAYATLAATAEPITPLRPMTRGPAARASGVIRVGGHSRGREVVKSANPGRICLNYRGGKTQISRH
jgi:hypothetical protein